MKTTHLVLPPLVRYSVGALVMLVLLITACAHRPRRLRLRSPRSLPQPSRQLQSQRLCP